MEWASHQERRALDRRWAVVRLVLSFLQVFGASLGFGLLMWTGPSRLTLAIIIATGLCTVLSRVLFGGRPGGRI